MQLALALLKESWLHHVFLLPALRLPNPNDLLELHPTYHIEKFLLTPANLHKFDKDLVWQPSLYWQSLQQNK